MDDLNIIIGENLNNIRNTRKLSLDDVSAMTGVSKGMLAQIERGKSSPTITTLWKISNGLKVPFSSFMEKSSINYEVINYDDIVPISEEDSKMKIYSVFPFDTKKNFEILIIELDEGCTHISQKHNEGVEEYIIVTNGVLEMDIDGTLITLKKGFCMRFLANIKHKYKNIGLEKCTFQNIIVYGT